MAAEGRKQKAREGALVGEKSKCKGPEVGKQPAQWRSRKKTAVPKPLRKISVVLVGAGEMDVFQKMPCLRDHSKEFDFI